MPLRGLKVTEKERLNEFLELAFKAQKDHRFLRLHKEKPLIDDWSRVYEYNPEVESGLDFSKPELVAHCGVYPQKMQYGEAVITNGGVRDVASHPEVRGKGYGLQVMKDARDFMFDHEVDVSLLFTGARHFYEQNGWRGGPKHSRFVIKREGLVRWKEKAQTLYDLKTLSLNPNRIEISVFFENPDEFYPILAEIYSQSHKGQYFAAHRTEGYWWNHLEARQDHKQFYFIARYENQGLAYVKCQMKPILGTSGVKLIFTESGVVPVFGKVGAPELHAIYLAFIRFLEEEALDADDYFEVVEFEFSQAHPIIRHLQYEGLPILDQTGFSTSPMMLVTNPYSLFTRLNPEITSRCEAGLLPYGGCTLEFDTTGAYPGGVLIENGSDGVRVQVTEKASDFEEWRKDIPDGISFGSVSGLTIAVGAIIPVEELDDEEDEEEMEVTFRGNGKEWLIGLFSHVTYDLYSLDHY